MIKKYFTIGELSKKTNVKDYVIRYWETVFPKLKPYKTDKGHRRYTEEHVNIINTIKELMWEKKYTIKGAKKALSQIFSNKKSNQLSLDFNFADTKKTLNEIKNYLEEVLEYLEEQPTKN